MRVHAGAFGAVGGTAGNHASLGVGGAACTFFASRGARSASTVSAFGGAQSSSTVSGFGGDWGACTVSGFGLPVESAADALLRHVEALDKIVEVGGQGGFRR